MLVHDAQKENNKLRTRMSWKLPTAESLLALASMERTEPTLDFHDEEKDPYWLEVARFLCMGSRRPDTHVALARRHKADPVNALTMAKANEEQAKGKVRRREGEGRRLICLKALTFCSYM